jgi:FKBP-type peptidyl-prolyl cis-trans isomerase SlyD
LVSWQILVTHSGNGLQYGDICFAPDFAAAQGLQACDASRFPFFSLRRYRLMQIVKNSVVTIHYEMYDADNTLLDKTEEPIAYLHGGYDGIFPLVEEALHGKAVGESITVTLTPDDAFGEPEEELVRVEPLDVLPEEVEVGMMFEADDPETGDVILFRVTDVADGKAVLDGNHPLAGLTIRFQATVAEVRPATPDEITHGHAHGEHGHHH